MSLTPSFLVSGAAEDMASYYTDVFPDGEVIDIFRAPMGEGDPVVITASIRVAGTDILIINGPDHTPNESFSFVVNCKDQDEVDYYWSRFVGDGGQEGMCGWCKDKFGFSWQVTPVEMPQLLGDPDPVRAGKAMQAMMTMRKLDLNAMKAAMDA